MKNIVDAKQAHITYQFMNQKKLLITNVKIWFNQQAISQHVVPNFVKVKVIDNTPSVIKTQKLVANIRIKQEFKFLYKKKSNLNNNNT
jgi:hypothetical protein